jgi:FkbH-like protein
MALESSPISGPTVASSEAAAVPARDPRLVATLRSLRHELASLLLDNLADWDKYSNAIAAAEDRDKYLEREQYVFIDYLAHLFETGDETYKHLYIGEKLKQIQDSRDDQATRRQRMNGILDRDESALLGRLKREVSPQSLDSLTNLLGDVRRVLLAEPPTTLNILLVGDCLYLDLMAFLTIPCLEDGVGLNPTVAVSKSGPTLRAGLKKLADRRFDLVFYSPFTYEFSTFLAPYFYPRQGFHSAAKLEEAASQALNDASATLRLLASEFECPIVVHNTLMLRRTNGSPKDRLKSLITLRARRILRRRLNAAMDDMVDRANIATFEHAFLFDERKLLAEHSERRLSRLLHAEYLQHPAFFGKVLAEKYRDLVFAKTRLLGRKVVVCDLDNTLWAGEIGEGAVAHFHDRQRSLLKLKEAGVVLAVNSKNDPAKVHWDGGLLKAEDFVNHQINWDSKVSNMKRIREALNLKYKDYVFIDDRADQLDMIGQSLPEIQLLDATSDRSWRLLDAWASLLPRQNEGDRTSMYHEREAREEFLKEQEEDQSALFANLKIHLTIRPAARPDLQRLTELINRTNQFNLVGSRTSFSEVSRWHDDPDTTLLLVDAADKFGRMGTVCAAVIHREDDRLVLPVFVLSCRVFGYGIENTVLNTVKRMAVAHRPTAPLTVVGEYKETPHNEPCRSTYPENGFTWNGSQWIYCAKADDLLVDPSWLTIENQIKGGGLGDSPSERKAEPSTLG